MRCVISRIWSLLVRRSSKAPVSRSEPNISVFTHRRASWRSAACDAPLVALAEDFEQQFGARSSRAARSPSSSMIRSVHTLRKVLLQAQQAFFILGLDQFMNQGIVT